MKQNRQALSQANSRPAKYSPTRKRLLLVDDEIPVLLAFKKIFEGFHTVIDTAETFEQAISMINVREYDVVIADLRLTGVMGKEGLEILQYIKENHPKTRFIMVTGYGNPDIIKKAYEIGADFYFDKPVSIQSLQKALKSLGIT